MALHKVVIIGSGFGGLFAAKALRKSEDVDVTIIARTNHHLFQPLLYQVATGILSAGEIAPSTREILGKQENAEVLLGSVYDIDVDEQVVCWNNGDRHFRTPYDTVIVATGAGQSYFGNDHFARYAPGMKTIDDAFELRARIFGAFERAELEPDFKERERLLTFVVVGAGPTGVEMAGQIRELADKTLPDEFKNYNPKQAKVILVDGADHALPAFGDKLGRRTCRDLRNLGIETRMQTLVTDIDAESVTLRDKNGNEDVIPCECKVWAAGVQGSPLGKVVADKTGAECDRAGRVIVNPDLTAGRCDNVFVIGDLMSVEGVPGVAQAAIQSARFVAKMILDRLDDKDTMGREFRYRDKGSMATISRFKAVVSVGRFQVGGFVAWLMWLLLHLLYIAGFKAQVSTLLHWAISFLSSARSSRTTTNQQMIARLALAQLDKEEKELMKKATSDEPSQQ